MSIVQPRTKRRWGEGKKVIAGEELKEVVSQAISHDTVSLALVHILSEYDVSLNSLQMVILEKGLDDIGTFELRRSRIPTELFKSILKDMDVMLTQYGPLPVHETEEATSRFLSPIFHRLIAEFEFSFRNFPESIFEGRVTKRGKIEYNLRAFGSISVLITELKFKVGNHKERLDAIAQVIAECVGSIRSFSSTISLPNSHKLSRKFLRTCVWDSLGRYFQFFKFVGAPKIPHSFLRGAFAGDPASLRNGLILPILNSDESTLHPSYTPGMRDDLRLTAVRLYFKHGGSVHM